jgi:hypothetical protein
MPVLKGFKEFITEGWCPMKKVGVSDSAKTHFVDGQPHSVKDQPSRVYFSGKKEYHSYGQLHRTNGPAVITPPSKIDPKGGEEYWLKGKQYSREEHRKKVIDDIYEH